MKVGCVGKPVSDLLKQPIIPYKVPCIIVSVVLDEIEATKRIYSRKRVSNDGGTFLSLDVGSDILIGSAQEKRQDIKALTIGIGEAEHIFVGVIIGVVESSPHIHSSILITIFNEKAEKHDLFIISQSSPIKNMVVDQIVPVVRVFIYSAVMVPLDNEITGVLGINVGVHPVEFVEIIALSLLPVVVFARYEAVKILFLQKEV